jgi:outer membrane immunogenic protein
MASGRYNGEVDSGPPYFKSTSPRGVVPAVLLAGERFTKRMKKILLFLALLSFSAAAGFAQESRQDASLSWAALIPPHVVGNTVQQDGTIGVYGVVASYRYMLTPRSALEVNYQYNQNIQKYLTSFNSIRVHTRMQEISGAYVRSFTFRNFNPFVEAGVGGYIFGPIKDQKTTDLDAKQSTNIGALYGAGIAYELSPSWDIRAEYRGIVVKAPNFGLEQYRTNRYYNISNPTIGVAYHF